MVGRSAILLESATRVDADCLTTMSNSPVFPIEWFSLANGMRVVFQPDPKIPLVVTHLCYLSGSGQDPPDQSGLAHLCEHLASFDVQDKSVKNYLQIIEQAGGQANGKTFQDRTSFSAVLPSHQLDVSLWVEARRMSQHVLKITPEILETQRNVVLQER